MINDALPDRESTTDLGRIRTGDSEYWIQNEGDHYAVGKKEEERRVLTIGASLGSKIYRLLSHEVTPAFKDYRTWRSLVNCHITSIWLQGVLSDEEFFSIQRRWEDRAANRFYSQIWHHDRTAKVGEGVSYFQIPNEHGRSRHSGCILGQDDDAEEPVVFEKENYWGPFRIVDFQTAVAPYEPTGDILFYRGTGVPHRDVVYYSVE